MRIQYCSDLHLEFWDNKKYLEAYPIQPVGDILILAGDIVPFSMMNQYEYFFDYLSANFKTTYWIPGNHEYYGYDVSKKGIEFLENIRSNIFLGSNFSVLLGNTRIIFSTLWSRIDKNRRIKVAIGMNDFRMIRSNGNLLTTDDYDGMHDACIKFIVAELSKPSLSSIVVTHHVPTLINYPTHYLLSPINSAFAVELSDLIQSTKIDYWIYGHHHFNVPEFRIGATRMVTNQLGYVARQEQQGFNTASIFTLT